MTEITQADRDAVTVLDLAANDIYRREKIMANHREQAEQETVAKIVAWLRKEAPAALHDPRMVGDAIEAEWGKQ